MPNNFAIEPMPTAPSQLEVYRGIVIDQDRDRVLFVRRSEQDSYLPGHYEFPGGKCEPGEDGMDALQREIVEETGLIIQPLLGSFQESIVHTDESLIPDGKHAGRLLISRFIASRAVHGQVILSSEHTHSAWDHIQASPARSPITPKSHDALRKLPTFLTLLNNR